MKVHLSPGEVLFVTFDDAEIQSGDDPSDGIRIDYCPSDKDGCDDNELKVTAFYEDDYGRVGEIYHATFDGDDNRVWIENKSNGTSDANEVTETITCSCGKEFEFTKGEQRFMQNVFKENYRPPVRCRECRKTRSVKNQVDKGDEQ